MKVLLIDTVDPILKNGLQKMGYQVDEDYTSAAEVISNKLPNYTGIVIRSRFPVNSQFLENAKGLKFIARVGAGMENIDIPFAKSLGISLIKAPEGNRDAVGEQAIGMLLMLLNNLKRADREVRSGMWRREENRGYEIHGKTVGILGYGYMGSAMAEKLQGFGCKVLAFDKYKSDYAPTGVEEVSLAELQERTDILSIHVPQSEETLGMIDDNFIDSFKKPFYLINTARGKSVKTQALVNALESGKVKGACLDVLEYEKASFENMFGQELPEAFQYLINSDKVILSPHIAGWSFESNEKMAEVILKKVANL